MKKSDIVKKIQHFLNHENIDAYIISGSDPHQNEYLPAHWQHRAWISGFTGSAGTIVIGKKMAGLWTDSRYFIQAEDELKNSGIQLFKITKMLTPQHLEWLHENIKDGATIGFDAALTSLSEYLSIKSMLKNKNIKLRAIDGLIDQLWTNRPPLPQNKIFVHQPSFQGTSLAERLKELRNKLQKQTSDYYLITALDDIAWLFGLRGTDIDFNPVFVSYCLVSATTVTLFVDMQKVTTAVAQYVHNNKVEIAAYNTINERLNALNNCSIFIDADQISLSIYETIENRLTIKRGNSLVTGMKSTKNRKEVENIRKAMSIDGVALSNFFYWLENNKDKQQISETEAAEKLTYYRKMNEYYLCDSFNAIVGFNKNGAIVHYSANEKNASIINDGILLLDSGGQYQCGTTDITRTIVFGAASKQQMKDYTLVLKGHIALASSIFPEGTTGVQLDILARKYLWDNKMNYGHGTGHGVGYFLNVHEGPHRISSVVSASTSCALLPGMVVSNEPGLYREDEYGIRIENLIVVIENQKSTFDNFLCFENLTLFPYDNNLIDWSMLNADEISYINQYHQKVYESLSPFLDTEVKEWLFEKTKPQG